MKENGIPATVENGGATSTSSGTSGSSTYKRNKIKKKTKKKHDFNQMQ